MSAALASDPLADVPDFDDVLAAAGRLDGVAHRTPVVTSRTADALAGAQLFFKCENLQRSGAFKFRGAYNAVASLAPDVRTRGVLAFSSGNHAQAIAYASRLLGAPVTIVMPGDAPPTKLAATREYGAEVVLYDRYREDREALGRRIATERGIPVIPPFDHRDVIAGQGTAALELIDEVGPLDTLLVPMGGGGLLAGSALAAAARSPGCQVIGVEPEAGNDGQRSFRSGEIVGIPVPRSIADGALTTRIGDRTFAIIRRLVTDIVTVPDDRLVAAMRFMLERTKLVCEPTGCLGIAAALDGTVPLAGRRVGIIISGGNVDLRAMAEWLA